MRTAVLYLQNLLEDEFRSYPEVRVRPVFPSGTRRSPDLIQDYDPDANSVHRRSGVMVQVRGKEFFFPEELMGDRSSREVNRLIDVVRDYLGAS